MMKNLTTSLVLHQRITTTNEKAKELRPFIEKLIHKAKQNDYQGNLYLKNNLFTKQAIEIVKKELVPRYENHKGGYTRVKFLGTRQNDKADMAYIELINNKIEVFEKNERAQAKANLGIPTFWKWEHKILRQEQEYFHNQLQMLNAQMEAEVEKFMSTQGPDQVANAEMTANIRKDIEKKYATKKKFLEGGLERSQIEEKIHLRQQDNNRYERMLDKYTAELTEGVRNRDMQRL